ncbi:hypothetical protein C8255_02265 [filamentous cyanobacterium CCP3]|nr:hypothetical protein C8255_02265 [filamentous cyanobacterium CCP3]
MTVPNCSCRRPAPLRIKTAISGLSNSNVGQVNGSVTHAGIGFRASTRPTSTYIKLRLPT